MLVDLSTPALSREPPAEESSCPTARQVRRTLIHTLVWASAAGFIYEAATQLAFPRITLWESHAVTIAFIALASTLAAYATVRQRANTLAQTRGHVAQYRAAVAEKAGLAASMEQVFEAILITDAEGRIQYVNRAFTRLTGYSGEEALGRNPRFLKSGVQDSAFYEELWRTVQSGRIWHGEIANRRKDGRVYTEEMTITPVRDIGGAISNYIAIKQDVTERRAAEEVRTFLASIVEASSDAIMTATPEGTLKSWNRGAELLYGYKADEVIGKPMDMLIPPYRTRVFREAAFERVLRGERVPSYVAQGLRKDGTRVHISSSVGPIKNAAGQITAFAAIVRDISALKTAELATALLASIVESAEDAIFSSTLDGTILTWNRGAEGLFGYGAAEMIGKNISVLAPPGRAHEQTETLDKSGKGIIQLETQRVKADRSLVEVSITVSPVTNAAGEVVRSSAIARDISGRKQAEEAVRQSEEKYRSLVANIPDVIWTANSSGEPVFASPSCQRICGYTPEEICRPGAWCALIHPEDLAGYQVAIQAMQAAHDAQSKASQKYDQVYRIRRKDGEWIWVHCRATGAYEMHGELYFDGVLSDITERKQLEQSLVHQATHDALTGLPNRQVFGERFQQALELARRLGERLALLCLDLDSFKVINDTLGRSIGDHLLHLAAQRLKGCLRDSEMLVRSGSDEFALVLTGVDDPQTATRIAERMLGALSAPFQAGGNDVFLSGSVGIAFYPQDGQDLPSLERSADAAMRAAKRGGRDRFQMFTAAMGTAAGRRLAVETELRRALQYHEFYLHFQPKIDLVTGAIAGVEALLRWNNPKLGIVGPSEFIPIAEETGLIIPISRWVLWEACRQERAWRDAGCEPVQISVNVSAAQFAGGGLPGIVARAFAETGMEASYLDLEVTESAIMYDVEESSRQLAELKQLGVSISLDDFGTGYSSLSYLIRFPIDALKIDQSFIRRMNDVDSTDPIVSAIVRLAHDLGMKTIAEGVESEGDLESLKAMGCDVAQGFLLGRPMAPDFLAQMLVRQPPRFVQADGAARPDHTRSRWSGRYAYAESEIKPLVN